jgi:hypothetical protein
VTPSLDRDVESRGVDASVRGPNGPARRPYLLAPLVAVLALVPVIALFHYPMDFGSAYHAGAVAWSTGNPEVVSTSWLGTPFYGLVMAVVSQAASFEVATPVMSLVNLLVWGALLVSVWSRLYGRVSSRWWWGTLVAAAVFAPAVTSIFWMQINLVIFALTLRGVALLGRRDRTAGALIGLALAVKPIFVLLPLVLLLRRDLRRAGAWSIGMAALLTAIGLGFLAWRAGDISVANPITYLGKFATQSRGPANACVIENYSPLALLCRLGVPDSTVLTVVIAVAVLGVGWLLIRQLRGGYEAKWGLFAAASLLSPMLGPIGWAIYQLLLAPSMLLLAYQFRAGRAAVFLWVNLGFVFFLTILIWDPLESYARAPVSVLVVSYTLGQFAQYFLILLWIQWMRMRAANPTRAVAPGRGAQAG